MVSINHGVWDGTPPGLNGEIEYEVILVRHAESESNCKLMSGEGAGTDVNSSLTKLGEEQAAVVSRLIKRLYDADPTHTIVRTSPLDRAIRTAGFLGVVDPLLRERNTTRLGTKLEELSCCFRKRVETVLREIESEAKAFRAEEPGCRLRFILVTHSLFISECIAQMTESCGGGFVHLTNGSFTTALKTTFGWELTMIGGVYHLAPRQRTGGHTTLQWEKPTVQA